MPAVCPTCNIEFKRDYERGTTYCPECGAEPSDLRIVSDVTFSETSSGKAVVTGQYVSNDSAGVVGSSLYGMQTGESRRQTIEKAKTRLDKIGRRLNIPEHIVDGAHRIFKLALTTNFVKGRKSQHVLSACLYLSCRIGKTDHMLMDFADALRVNVFNIGATYLQLVKNQNIKQMPVVDPTVFIQRFVAKLQFGMEGSRRVVNDAKLLVQRMGKDWLQQGRRPAGVAAACILLAARMNNFRRSKAEIVQVAMIAEETLQRRLNEFKNTPAGGLTVADFRDTNVDSAADPPSFTRHRELEKLYAEKKAREDELEAQGEASADVYLDKELEKIARELDQDDGRTIELKSDVEAVLRIPQLQEAYVEMEKYEAKVKRDLKRKQLESKRQAGEAISPEEEEDEDDQDDVLTKEQEEQVEAAMFGGLAASDAAVDDPVKEPTPDDPTVKISETQDAEATIDEPVKISESQLLDDPVKISETQDLEATIDDQLELQATVKISESQGTTPMSIKQDSVESDDGDCIVERVVEEPPRISASLAAQMPPWMNGSNAAKGPGRAERFLLEFRKKRASRLALEAEAKVARDAAEAEAEKEAAVVVEESLSDYDDEEIESVILTEEEIEIKTKVWMSINREFLIEQERKRLRAEADKANGVSQKQFRKKRKTGRKGGTSTSGSTGGATAGDSAANMVKERAHSKKINYAALNSLFGNA